MSSDESSSTKNLSIATNQTVAKNKKPGKRAINSIGTFVLGLYHRSLITPDNGWCIKKTDLQKEYESFINSERGEYKEIVGTADIGTLLHHGDFIFNTQQDCNLYRIKYLTLFKFRNDKIKELDDLKKKINIKEIIPKNESVNNSSKLDQNNAALSIQEIDESESKQDLEYQGTTMQQRGSLNTCYTNISCCICEEEFSTPDDFEEHIQKHGEESNFEYLTLLKKMDNPIFSLKYRLCKKSHCFCFEIESFSYNIILEKIIIVQSRTFYYADDMRVPCKICKNDQYRFFVDSHLFTKHLEQPIVLICHIEGSEETRIVEQHHFMRSEEFPKVNFAIKPYSLPNKTTFKPKFKLPDYFPPKEIRDSLKGGLYNEKLMKVSNEFRDYVQSGKKLQPQTIRASLNILLQIEDIDTMNKYLSLTQQNIKLRKFENEYSFRFQPNQKVHMESILSAYDEVVLTTCKNTKSLKQLIMQNTYDIMKTNTTFVGEIIAINSGRICFKCDKKINTNVKYTIACRPSRLNVRYQYRSLELLPINMGFLNKFLFPAKIMPKPLPTASLSLYNNKIELIPEQLQAVRNIAEGPRNDATYIIFGPPGTGKTTTLVESILQLVKKSETKILVTASSNSACDEVALRLLKYLQPLDIERCLVRIYSRTAGDRTDTIDDDLLAYSNIYCGQFYPSVEILHKYRIVVCTLSVVAKLATGKFGRYENGLSVYTHLFIDEVAATMEAEALIAITTILSAESCLIISGDHKQLGPILESKRAQALGLDVSLMERLLERDCYRVDIDTGDYDRTIQTRLRRNYRSHPAIVRLYSGLYYNHNVEPFAKTEDVSLGDVWYKTRNKNFPIIFHAIYTPSISANESSSLYNLGELEVVMDYVKDLMYFGVNEKPVEENDIGIISPYKSQYSRIQEELKLRKWFNIETGSVETFQGKEKDIIIVSFVRSGTSTLGFLENPRRLNVTLSRPKSILILIGNPNTLSLNTEFDYIINECKRHKTFVGKSQKEIDSTEKLTSLNKNLQELHISSKDTEPSVKSITEVKKISRDENESRTKMKVNANDNKGKQENLATREILDKLLIELPEITKENVKNNSEISILQQHHFNIQQNPHQRQEQQKFNFLSNRNNSVISPLNANSLTLQQAHYNAQIHRHYNIQQIPQQNPQEIIPNLTSNFSQVCQRQYPLPPAQQQLNQTFSLNENQRLRYVSPHYQSIQNNGNMNITVNKNKSNLWDKSNVTETKFNTSTPVNSNQNLTKSNICSIKPSTTNFSHTITSSVKDMSKETKENIVKSISKLNSSNSVAIANITPMPRQVSVSSGSHQNSPNNCHRARDAIVTSNKTNITTIKENKNKSVNYSNISLSTNYNSRIGNRLAPAPAVFSTLNGNQNDLIIAQEALDICNKNLNNAFGEINEKSKNNKKNKKCIIS